MGTNMPIDLTDPNKPKLNPTQAARYFASSRGDRPTHKSRVVRYILDGVVGPNGDRVYLEALRQGNQWVTTPEAIQAFCEALTPRPARPQSGSRAAAVPSKKAERAGRELAKHRI